MKTIYERHIEPIPNNRIDISILRKRGNSKTFNGWLVQKIKDARKEENTEMVVLLSDIYKVSIGFQKAELVRLESWRGKSGVKFMEEPEKVICIRFRRSEPKETPKEIRTELLRDEINRVIWAINLFNSKDWIETSEVAEKVYNKSWHEVFSTRHQHIKLVEIFNYLEYKGKIEYSRSGKVKLK